MSEMSDMAAPRLLDLFCGAGGCSAGYRQAGFEVVGVDIDPQPHYPFKFVQADAMTFPLDGFDAIHASPPCQDHSMMGNFGAPAHGTGWLLAAIRERLIASGLPWVIENVPGAPMRPDYKICGCMVGLGKIRRERWFETSWHGFELRAPCHHAEPAIPIVGHGVTSWYRKKYGPVSNAERRAAMGIDWMTWDEIGDAIPPAYTKYIGAQLLEHIATSRRVLAGLRRLRRPPADRLRRRHLPADPAVFPRSFGDLVQGVRLC